MSTKRPIRRCIVPANKASAFVGDETGPTPVGVAENVAVAINPASSENHLNPGRYKLAFDGKIPAALNRGNASWDMSYAFGRWFNTLFSI